MMTKVKTMQFNLKVLLTATLVPLLSIACAGTPTQGQDDLFSDAAAKAAPGSDEGAKAETSSDVDLFGIFQCPGASEIIADGFVLLGAGRAPAIGDWLSKGGVIPATKITLGKDHRTIYCDYSLDVADREVAVLRYVIYGTDATRVGTYPNSTVTDHCEIYQEEYQFDCGDDAIGDDDDDTGICGDGVLDNNETCDDGNTDEGDRCSADCSTVTRVPCSVGGRSGSTFVLNEQLTNYEVLDTMLWVNTSTAEGEVNEEKLNCYTHLAYRVEAAEKLSVNERIIQIGGQDYPITAIRFGDSTYLSVTVINSELEDLAWGNGEIQFKLKNNGASDLEITAYSVTQDI